MRPGSRGGAPAGQRGFTYFGILFTVALMGIGLAAVGELYSTAERREREQQLLFVGDQYASALKRYRAANNKYPQSLEELLGDPGQLPVRRYLRRIYVDPITNSTDWGLEKSDDGRIVGVYSRSEQEPLKVANFPQRFKAFEEQKRYADWKFLATGAATKAKPLGAPGADDGGAPRVPRPPGQPAPAGFSGQFGAQPAGSETADRR
jgi:type II secretory pathway pseudopilin PulG